MKKILSLVLAVLMLASITLATTSCGNEIIVQTNAFFAPFEYYNGNEIVGVDVEIMNLVGQKLGKKVTFKHVDFAVIIDNVKDGKVCDAGAAGITITDARKEKVDFSVPYYTSVQYVIFAKDANIAKRGEGDKQYIVWDALAGMTIGVQTDTTGYLYADGEINATEDDPKYGYDGALYGTNTKIKTYDNAQLAADGIGSNMVNCVIIDKLPAEYITSKNQNLVCLPLYYAGATEAEDAPVEEQYAICVTKGNTTLLNAINEVLNDLISKGEIEKMVMNHMISE